MVHLIDKDALEAKIEKLQLDIIEEKKLHEDNAMWYNGINHGFNLFKEIINTIEVKEVQEEPKKCMYALNDFNDEDRKVTCDGCEEYCKYAKLDAMLDDSLSKETKESWNERLDRKDFRERYKRIAESEAFKKAHEGISIGDTIPIECEEPISDDLKIELNKYIKDHFTIDKEELDRFGIEEKDYMYSMDKSDILALVEHFINWQKTKEEHVSEELEEAAENFANEIEERVAYPKHTCFSEETLHHLRFGFVQGTKWQKQQMMKDAINGKIIESANTVSKQEEFLRIVTLVYSQDDMNSYLQAGDKVTLVIIKED